MVVKIEIVGATDVIPLRNDALDYLRAWGGSGWGKAPVANFRTEGAAHGWKFRGQRVTGRTYVLPAVVFGTSPFEINERVRRLARVVTGEFQLRFTSHDGAVFTIPAVYDSGLEGSYSLGSQAADFRALTVQCPDPFWTSQEVETLEWVYAPGVPFLEDRVLSSADLSGVRQVTNSGDVESRPTWVFEGPFDSVEVAVNGSGFTYDASMLLGESLTVRHDGWAWTVIDQNGDSMFTNVVWGARFPNLPAGESSVLLNLAGADTGTRASMFWPERREVMF